MYYRLINFDDSLIDRISPICLPLDDHIRNRQFTHDNPFVAGWGKLTENGTSSAVLQQLQVPVLDLKKCRDLHLKIGISQMVVNFFIGEHIICAGGDADKGFCFGDSGGPLMLPIRENDTFPFYQIGIVAHSYGCAKPNLPGAYTKIQHYANWIKAHVE